MGMFDFMFMAPSEEHLVANTTLENGAVVDTCSVNDGDQPFETGVRHPDYNEGEWIIVEAYPTREAAADGHKRWEEKMKTPPDELTDIANSEIQQMLGQRTFARQSKQEG